MLTSSDIRFLNKSRAKKDSRPYLHHYFFDQTNQRVVACNGQTLRIVHTPVNLPSLYDVGEGHHEGRWVVASDPLNPTTSAIPDQYYPDIDRVLPGAEADLVSIELSLASDLRATVMEFQHEHAFHPDHQPCVCFEDGLVFLARGTVFKGGELQKRVNRHVQYEKVYGTYQKLGEYSSERCIPEFGVDLRYLQQLKDDRLPVFAWVSPSSPLSVLKPTVKLYAKGGNRESLTMPMYY